MEEGLVERLRESLKGLSDFEKAYHEELYKNESQANRKELDL